jgi:hypothetical protein
MGGRFFISVGKKEGEKKIIQRENVRKKNATITRDWRGWRKATVVCGGRARECGVSVGGTYRRV